MKEDRTNVIEEDEFFAFLILGNCHKQLEIALRMLKCKNRLIYQFSIQELNFQKCYNVLCEIGVNNPIKME